MLQPRYFSTILTCKISNTYSALRYKVLFVMNHVQLRYLSVIYTCKFQVYTPRLGTRNTVRHAPRFNLGISQSHIPTKGKFFKVYILRLDTPSTGQHRPAQASTGQQMALLFSQGNLVAMYLACRMILNVKLYNIHAKTRSSSLVFLQYNIGRYMIHHTVIRGRNAPAYCSLKVSYYHFTTKGSRSTFSSACTNLSQNVLFQQTHTLTTPALSRVCTNSYFCTQNNSHTYSRTSTYLCLRANTTHKTYFVRLSWD